MHDFKLNIWKTFLSYVNFSKNNFKSSVTRFIRSCEVYSKISLIHYWHIQNLWHLSFYVRFDQHARSSYPEVFCKNQLFIVCPSQRIPKDLERKVLTIYIYILYRLSKKQKEVWKLVSLYHFINWTSFIVCLSLLLEILGNMVIVTIRSSVCDALVLKLTSTFSLSCFSA